MIGIYKITNKVNNKIYIGQSNNIDRRWHEHIRASQPDKYSNSNLRNANTPIHRAMQNMELKILNYHY